MSEKEQNEDESIEMTTKPPTLIESTTISLHDAETTAELNHQTFTEDKDLVDAEGNENDTSSSNDQTQPLTSVVEFVEVTEDGTHPKGSLNESNSALDGTTRKFRNGFFELVEELKLRRTLDNENEKQIEALFTEKSQMHQKWEEEVSKNNVQKNVHEKKIKDVTKQFEERLHQHEIDKAKDDIAVQCNMKEMNQLKDEIRALHLAKYSIEKRASELDRELQIQATARGHHVKQMTEIEKKYSETISQTHEAFDLVNRVELNVGAAVRLHKKLSYYNEHQRCQLNSYKKGLESKQQELANLKILVESLKASIRAAEDNGRISEQNEKESRIQSELCRHLQSQLNEARKENKNLIDSLKEAHSLVDRHVGIANKHSELESLAQFELDEAKSESQKLEKEVGELTKSIEKMQHENAEKVRTWNTEKEEKGKELVDVISRYEALTHAHNTLEDNNRKLCQRIDEMKKEMEILQCSEKEKAEALADLSLLIEKIKADNQNQIHDLQKQLTTTRLQALEELNSVKYWKEKFTAIERKAEEVKTHKEANRHSQLQVTQTDEPSYAGIKLNAKISTTRIKTEVHFMEKENTDVKRTKTKDGRLKSEKEEIFPSVSENVNLSMPSSESIPSTSKNDADNEANSIPLDDNGDVKLVEASREVTSGNTSVLVSENDRITAVGNNGEESILESSEDRVSCSTVNGNSDTKHSAESAENITTKINENGVSTADVIVSSEIQKTNPAFLTTPSSSETLVKDNKERASEEAKKDFKCFMTVQAESTSSILPLLSQPRKEEMEGKEKEKKKFEQTSQITTSVVCNKFTLKSCLRDKSLTQGFNPHVYKKLRFNLPTKQSLTNVLPRLDNVLEGDKNESLLPEGLKTKIGYPEKSMSVSIYQNVDNKMRTGATKEEQVSRYCEGIEAQMEPKLTQINVSSNDGTSLSKSCDEHFKNNSDRHNSNNTCTTKGNSSDYQELFSDEEDKGQTVIKCQDVGQQIERIQQFLNKERLTGSRKRKFPDDSHSPD